MTKEQKELYRQGEEFEEKMADYFQKKGVIVPFEAPMRENQWYRKIVPGALCSDGSEYPIYFNRGSENSLVLFLEGGGVCMDDDTASYPISAAEANIGHPNCYAANFRRYFEYTCFDNELGSRGIVEKNDVRNPFANWNFVVTAYGTGDVYAGTGEHVYHTVDGEQKKVLHYGYINFVKSLEIIKEIYPAPERILLLGASAGGFGIPAVAEEVINAYSECNEIIVYSDSATCANPQYKMAVPQFWQAPERLVQALHTDDIMMDWYEALYRKFGNKIKYLYSTSVRDQVFTSYINYYLNGKMECSKEAEEEFLVQLKAAVDRIKELDESFYVMINDFPARDEKYPAATLHTVIQSPEFYEKTSNGITPVQWLWNAVNGNGYDAGLKLLHTALGEMPEIKGKIPHGDMPGDKVEIEEEHIEKAELIFRELMRYLPDVLKKSGNQKAVVTVCGGSGVGKSEIASLVSYYLQCIGIGSYTLSGDNYPRRNPVYNDAERLRIYRESGVRALVKEELLGEETRQKLQELQRAEDDANETYCNEYSWYSCYLKGALDGLREYIGTEKEIDFQELTDIVRKFKHGDEKIWLKRMGRTDSEIWYEKVDFSGVNVLVIEWTHGNSDLYQGADIPILLNSTPQETLEHRKKRNRDGKTDSPFTMRVLEIEQELLKRQAKKAKIIVSKQGKLLSYDEYREVMNE